ncbi:hypothetical protein EUGRSUZ_A01987 [Eucalyptus grandis]|uniref:Uncharacterized protein n=2 Tax=Eucalyptus grandis TaxID=71139 RepID=A0ACC3M4U8_EUCGR|nr:hypothetical protein EUGRSUZ_A01987 [Eucalyptus grandis]
MQILPNPPKICPHEEALQTASACRFSTSSPPPSQGDPFLQILGAVLVSNATALLRRRLSSSSFFMASRSPPQLRSVPLLRSSSFRLNFPDPLLIELNLLHDLDGCQRFQKFRGGHWVPIGWVRIHQLVQPVDFGDSEDDVANADTATPCWERPVGPTWWCHVVADHPFVQSWLSNAQWLHPAISISLRDESRLMSERTKHLLYVVPVRVAGGLPFEMSGQSAGDPSCIDEDDIPIVLRSWQAQNFLLASLHIRGSAAVINILGFSEVQELLAAGGSNIPQSIHEVVAHLACRLPRWMTCVLFHKNVFGAADEIELMLMNRRSLEGGHLFTMILNQAIQSRAWLQDKSLTVTHNLGVFGGCGLVLSIIIGLFGINVGGTPGSDHSPCVFALFSCFLLFLGAALIAIGLLYVGIENPIVEENVEVRKLALQELAQMLQHEAESHAQVRKNVPRKNVPPIAADLLPNAIN